MVILIDTNVVIDFLMGREPFCGSASEIIEKCADKELTGYIAIHSIPNLWYILRKVPEIRRREWLRDICSILQVAGASHEDVLKAIDNHAFSDFEDCLQERCAAGVGAEYIVTRNEVDFAASEIPAISPENLLKVIP